MGAHVLVKAPQQVRAAIDQGHIDTQAMENAGELHGDIAAPHNDDRLGQLRQVESFLRSDHMLYALDLSGPNGTAARGDQHLGRGHRAGLVPARDFQGVRIEEPGRTQQKVGPRLREVGGIDAGEPGDLLVLRGEKSLPIKTDVPGGPSIALGGLELSGELGGIDHELLGHAATHDACAPDAILLGDRHLGAGHGREPGRADSSRAGADDEEVVVVIGHKGLRISRGEGIRRRRRWRPAPGRQDPGKAHDRRRRSRFSAPPPAWPGQEWRRRRRRRSNFRCR